MASGLITTYLGAGAAASRPASPSISSGACALWYSTDTEAFSVWDGAAWNAVTTGTAPQFTTIELGHASDTTLSRTGAGDIAVEGNVIYRAGGTDVPLGDGGTGASLVDPNADRILFWDDSAGQVTWLEVSTGLTVSGTTITSSGEVLIEEYTADGTTGTKTFSAIPGTYRSLRLEWVGRSSQAATSTNITVQFNGDTASNYDSQLKAASATTLSASESLGATSALVGSLSAASATANYAGSGRLFINEYAGTTFFKSGQSQYSYQTGTASGNLTNRAYVIGWRSTSAITSMTVALASGNYVSGTKLRLYGIQ